MRFARFLSPAPFLSLFTLFFLGCSQTMPSSDEKNLSGTYVDFVVNVHDWVFPEKSVDTLNRIIDIHEKYGVPVDIYLDDQVIQIYASDYPELIERLRDSDVVAISYHIRPPSPYASGFDFLGLKNMNSEELYDTLLTYETHALNLATGMPDDGPGGYEYLKDLIGYPPYVVSSLTGGSISETLDEIWSEMGAQFTLVHNVTTELGERKNGLYLRPEDVEVKAYEDAGKKTAEEELNDALGQVSEKTLSFINLKWHENDFYAKETTWGAAYFVDGDSHGTPLAPAEWSANTIDFASDVKMKAVAQTESQWTFYEELVKYASEHKADFSVINSRDLLEMIQ